MKQMGRLCAILICAALLVMILSSCAAKAPVEESNTPNLSSTLPDEPIGSPGASIEPDDEVDAAIIESDTANADTASIALPEPLSMNDDIGISINGQWFPIWQDATGLLQALGGDYALTSAPSCVFEGEDKEFAYDGFYVYTNPDGDKDIWYSIFLESDKYSTARGIRVGDGLDVVIAAYGDRYYWEGESILTYSISGVEGDIASPCIQFTVSEDSVTAIEIYYPTNVS